MQLFTGRALLAAAASLALTASAAEAQVFFGEDSDGDEFTRSTLMASVNAENMFLAHLEGVGTEDFETSAGGTPLPLVFPGAGTATLQGSGSVQTQGAGTDGTGRYPTSGVNYFETNAAGGFSIDFTDPVAAFGFYGVDIGDFGGNLALSFLNGAASVAMINVAHAVGAGGSTGGNAFFFGYINEMNPFTRVVFNLTEGPSNDVFAFDDMTIGSPEQVVGVVPEPMSIVLLATGLLGLAVLRLRRREKGDGLA